MNDNCEQCGGKCKSPFANSKKDYNKRSYNQYWHIAQKYVKENKKPACCDICNEPNDDLKFAEEPFLAEIWCEHFEIWMCDYCYCDSRDNI